MNRSLAIVLMVAQDRWLAVCVPIMEQVREAEDQGQLWSAASAPELPAVSTREVEPESVLIQAASLIRAGYVSGDVIQPMEAPYPVEVIVSGLEERGRRAIRQWPTDGDPGQVLLWSLEQAIEKETDEAKQGKLRQILGSLQEVGTTVVAEVAGGVVRGVMGLP